MKSPHFVLYVLAMMLFGSATSHVHAQSKAKYVVLISIDALRPEFYLDKSWPAPNLQYLKDHGAYAEGVRGIAPTVTYPSHTTIITGALPARHGILANSMREERLIQTPTLWDAVKEAGLKSAVISWPVAVGAPVDYLLAESWQDSQNDTRPVNPHSYPEGLFEEVQREATGHLHYDEVSLAHLSIDENFSRMAAYIIKTYKPNFTTVHICSPDAAQHRVGREGHEVNRAVASADHAVSNILDAIEQAGIADSTAVIVMGDHGFMDIHSSFAPNVLLADMGLLTPGTGRGLENWQARFSGSGGSSFLQLKDPKDLKLVDEIKQALEALPASVRRLFRIVEKEELIQLGADRDAVLALTAAKGISISGNATGELVGNSRGGTHGYFPEFKELETGFIAFGAGINDQAVIPEMGLVDIAPLISALLGLSFDAPDGVLLPGILSNSPRDRRAQ